ncbi:MAG: hypothetical protein HY072_09855 [Deltaproteobacteria bacterium]|nr:hypothetical protein [Deltaproteobacteria bacterium]
MAVSDMAGFQACLSQAHAHFDVNKVGEGSLAAAKTLTTEIKECVCAYVTPPPSGAC